MQVTKEYCDKCGKEIDNGPLENRSFPIIYGRQKGLIRFRDRVNYIETTKTVCEKCLKQFLEWWNSETTEKEDE